MTTKEKNEDMALVIAIDDAVVRSMRTLGDVLEDLEESEQSSAACAELALALGHLVGTRRALKKRRILLGLTA